MASIVARGGRFSVVYNFDDGHGNRKQKWETYATLAEAKRRKTEVEYQQDLGSLHVPNCKTLTDLLKEYVSLYGKSIWSMSVYKANTSLMKNYIIPMIGDLKLTEITARVLEKYYLTLMKTKAVPKMTDTKYNKKEEYVGTPTVRKIHSLLRSVFNQGVKWELMEKNPALYATVPKAETKKRDIWDAPTLFRAMELCRDDRLKLCMNLSFACTMRLGEVLGLTWDCVDISEQSIMEEKASIFINKELQRVDKASMTALEKRDVIAVFPESSPKNRTVLVLKKPKTATSTRKVFLPNAVAQMLIKWKEEQDQVREALGSEYMNYQLVIAGPLGTPTEGSRIGEAFNALIEANDLPKVVFHSIRHSSVTYKLILNGGDIKAVQGDSGHAQAKMVTDQYSHILDEGRVKNAHVLNDAFYGRRGSEVPYPEAAHEEPTKDVLAQKIEETGFDVADFASLFEKPEMVQMMKMLMGAMKK